MFHFAIGICYLAHFFFKVNISRFPTSKIVCLFHYLIRILFSRTAIYSNIRRLGTHPHRMFPKSFILNKWLVTFTEYI